MITPDKHTDIKTSVMYISGLILAEIQHNGIICYDDLHNVIINKVGNRIGDNFEHSLSFLFLIDKIQYNKELDSFKVA